MRGRERNEGRGEEEEVVVRQMGETDRGGGLAGERCRLYGTKMIIIVVILLLKKIKKNIILILSTLVEHFHTRNCFSLSPIILFILNS